jgi:type IV pilus assembly protein PilV
MNKAADRRLMPQRQGGFTLIEVLVGLLIFSFGILGFVGMQARAMQLSVDAEDRNRAALLASELISGMWTNGSAVVDSATKATWLEHVQDPTVSGLPQADGEVTEPDADGVVQVTITWKAPSAAAAAASSVYTTEVVIP